MSRRFLPVLLPALVVVSSPIRAQDYEKDIRPILVKYCNNCHSSEKKKGDIDLEQIAQKADVEKHAGLWQGVSERVRKFEMPPEGSKMPSQDERKKLADWSAALGAKKLASDCKSIANDANQNFYKGHVMSRRLTRAEYDNTVRDLVGIDVKPASAFPTDGSGGEGFDTIGDALFTSPIHIEQYLAAAEKILDAVWKDPAAKKRILVAEQGKNPREAAAAIVRAFADRAFRRPASDAEIEKLLTVFDSATKRGVNFDAAIRQPLKGVLISPHFLFLVEPEGEKDGIIPLADFPLAARLSYFLWASMPDAELFALAKSGKLGTDDELKKQVRRMLKDPKSRGFAEAFATQWLDLRPLGTTAKPDAAKFPEFDDALAVAMREEVVLLFDHILRDDHSVLEIVDADYAFVNDRLAKLYGLPKVDGSQMRKVTLPDRTRGGAITSAAVLTTTSYPLRTSPVLRGKWVLEEVLGSKVPPPPPNVPELPKDESTAKGLTFRQQLEVHRKKAECAACHARMDPLGFGLENFDPIGRWRTDVGGVKVDATGEVPGGAKFAGPAELKQLVLKRKGEYIWTLSRKMLSYALGRQLYPFDQCVIDDAAKALMANENKPSAMIEKIVLSYPFRHRFVKK